MFGWAPLKKFMIEKAGFNMKKEISKVIFLKDLWP